MSDKQERFSKLADGNDLVDQIITDRTVGDSWFIGMDYDTKNNPGKEDLGTRRVPMSRIALLTESGLVPAAMLPSTVSTMVEGDMEYNSETKQWKFTAANGDVYGCPIPLGNTPDESVVYVDNTPSGEDYYQYMFVPAVSPTATNIGTFYCLPSPYILVDGDATHIHDDADEYTRTVNIRVANTDVVAENDGSATLQIVTDAETGSNVLAHKVYSDTERTAGNTQDLTPGFGETFKVPKFTVDKSGHLVECAETEVSIPSTPATRYESGLVMIGSGLPNKIGMRSEAGGWQQSDDGYTYVAAADHVHNAATLVVRNDGNGTNIVYDGSSNVTVNMNTLVGATLPSAGPTQDSVLAYNGTELEWKSPSEVSSVNFAEASGYWFDVNNRDITENGYIIGDLVERSHVGNLSISTGADGFTGVADGKVYMLSYDIVLKNSDAAPYYERLGVGVTVDGGGSSVTEGQRSYFIDASRTGEQVVNGTVMFKCPAGSNGTVSLFIFDADTNIGTIGLFPHGVWSVKAERFQIAELK